METKQTIGRTVPKEVYEAISELNENFSEIMFAITQAMGTLSECMIDDPIQDLAILSTKLKIIQEYLPENNLTI
jgi:hypothetical protein